MLSNLLYKEYTKKYLEIKNVIIWYRNLEIISLAKWSRLTVSVVSQLSSIYSWYVVLRMSLHFTMVFLPQIHNLGLTMRKASNTHNWGAFYCISNQYLLYTVKVIKTKESLRNCHSNGILFSCRKIWWRALWTDRK